MVVVHIAVTLGDLCFCCDCSLQVVSLLCVLCLSLLAISFVCIDI